MASIALIGPDGSGKTTLCRMLEASSLLPFKYVYMGVNFSVSNVVLPTTRLVTWWRGRASRPFDHTRQPSSKATTKRSVPQWLRPLRDAAGLLNRLAEEWYRQFVSWFYQCRGYVVLYDRHFVFDFGSISPGIADESWRNRLHRWFLARFYPWPSFVILLDAPSEVLFRRKGEFSSEILEERRRTLLRQAEIFGKFVRVDAAQPLEKVYSAVLLQVLEVCGRNYTRRRSTASSARQPAEK